MSKMSTKPPSSSLGCETILSVLARHVAKKPDHQLFRWVDKKGNVSGTLTYKQLWEQSCAVAQLLQTEGIKKGGRVMIAYPFGLEFLAGMFGCMILGVVGCSAYPPNPQRLTEELPAFNKKATDAGAEYALTTNAFRRFMNISNITGNRTQVSLHCCPILHNERELISFVHCCSGNLARYRYSECYHWW